ncbi:MAG: hypothetical protein HIU91_01315 [Acidobacteria bacterium]|nr:hypothetical protein [Acidobacteriota bacterium]
MQNAKDTFYEVLRGRLAALNPDRTIALRGAVRPGLLVQENELLTAVALPDCFRMRWSVSAVDADGAMPLVAMECMIDYETAGTAMNGGMDRGRALAAMDGELQSSLNTLPRSTPKSNYAGLAFGNAVLAMKTNVWWGEVAFAATVVKDDRLARTATVVVMSYQEAGEL